MDLYAGRPSRDSRDHPASTDALRRPRAHRQALQPDSNVVARQMPAAGVRKHITFCYNDHDHRALKLARFSTLQYSFRGNDAVLW